VISVPSGSEHTIFFQSLGCPKNLVDTEVMLGITTGARWKIVSDPSVAKVIVLNTCSFINDSKRESIDAILSLSQYKQEGACERLIVTGCLPQRYKADLMVSFPEVDAFVGTGQYHQILDFISGKKEDDKDFRHPKYIHSEHTPRINTQPSFRTYLKIAEGCIKNCAFCIIPKIRGTLRSRSIQSLVTEAENLARAGVKELNLIAQDLTDYGRDLRNGTNLERLLQGLLSVSDIEWIRLFYVYPDELDERLLELIATEPRICKYLDMPVQHINDRMLQLMNRRGVTGQRIRDRMAKLRALVPGVSLRSTVMVGYPGETKAAFEELKSFVREARFDHLGVFAYSLEEGTPSYDLPDQVDEAEKQTRREELLSHQQKISHNILKARVGQTHRVLVEGPSEESPHLTQARHQGQAPDIDGCVLVRTAGLVPGSFVDVRLEQAMEYDYIAQLV